MFLRVGDDGRRVDRDDVAVVIHEAKGIAGSLELMQEPGDLGRIALEVQFDEHGGTREPLDGLLHAFLDQRLRPLGVDRHKVKSVPFAAQPVECGHWHLDRSRRMQIRPAF